MALGSCDSFCQRRLRKIFLLFVLGSILTVGREGFMDDRELCLFAAVCTVGIAV